jgi:hypothetical protein
MMASTTRPPDTADIEAMWTEEPDRARYKNVRVAIAIACLLGAQFLHWNVIDDHARVWRASGDFFFLLAFLEGFLTVLIIARLRPWVAAAGIALSAVPVFVWAWDRSLGLPFGPAHGIRGTIGRSDVMSVVFELLTIAALWPFLRHEYSEATPRRTDLVGRVVITATCLYVAAFSVWAVLADQASTSHAHAVPAPAVNQTVPVPVAQLGPLNTTAP